VCVTFVELNVTVSDARVFENVTLFVNSVVSSKVKPLLSERMPAIDPPPAALFGDDTVANILDIFDPDRT
jgi:hypothetical protein